MKYESMTSHQLAEYCGVSAQYISRLCREKIGQVIPAGTTQIKIKSVKKIGDAKNSPYLIKVRFIERKKEK